MKFALGITGTDEQIDKVLQFMDKSKKFDKYDNNYANRRKAFIDRTKLVIECDSGDWCEIISDDTKELAKAVPEVEIVLLTSYGESDVSGDIDWDWEMSYYPVGIVQDIATYMILTPREEDKDGHLLNPDYDYPDMDELDLEDRIFANPLRYAHCEHRYNGYSYDDYRIDDHPEEKGLPTLLYLYVLFSGSDVLGSGIPDTVVGLRKERENLDRKAQQKQEALERLKKVPFDMVEDPFDMVPFDLCYHFEMKDKVFAFTGTFAQFITNKDQLVNWIESDDAGGIYAETVDKTCDYLVVGDVDFPAECEPDLEAALKFRKQGKDIRIIKESDLLNRLLDI